MDEQGLREWIEQRLAEGQDATVYEFIREVLDDRGNLRTANEGAAAKISEHERTIADMTDEMSRIKAHNYDLLMGANADSGGGDDEVIENNEDEGEIYHIDNLFVEKGADDAE